MLHDLVLSVFLDPIDVSIRSLFAVMRQRYESDCEAYEMQCGARSLWFADYCCAVTSLYTENGLACVATQKTPIIGLVCGSALRLAVFAPHTSVARCPAISSSAFT